MKMVPSTFYRSGHIVTDLHFVGSYVVPETFHSTTTFQQTSFNIIMYDMNISWFVTGFLKIKQ